MVISKNTIRLSLISGNTLPALIDLLNISRNNDKLTFNKILVYFSSYMECINSTNDSGEKGNFQEKFNLITRISLELKDLLDAHIQDAWTVPFNDSQNYKEPSDIFAQYPNLFVAQEDSISSFNILFLAANPNNTDPLKLGTEFSTIEDAIQLSKYNDKINLNSRWALQKDDLTRVMLRYKPKIAHFSGHGSPDGEILLVDGENYQDGIEPEALGAFFGGFKDKLKCVVLNACYSEIQAKEIRDNEIQYVIGMKKEIPDEAAIAFSNAFYSAIGAMEEIPNAYQLGINAMGLTDQEDSKIPILLQ